MRSNSFTDLIEFEIDPIELILPDQKWLLQQREPLKPRNLDVDWSINESAILSNIHKNFTEKMEFIPFIDSENHLPPLKDIFFRDFQIHCPLPDMHKLKLPNLMSSVDNDLNQWLFQLNEMLHESNSIFIPENFLVAPFFVPFTQKIVLPNAPLKSIEFHHSLQDDLDSFISYDSFFSLHSFMPCDPLLLPVEALIPSQNLVKVTLPLPKLRKMIIKISGLEWQPSALAKAKKVWENQFMQPEEITMEIDTKRMKLDKEMLPIEKVPSFVPNQPITTAEILLECREMIRHSVSISGQLEQNGIDQDQQNSGFSMLTPSTTTRTMPSSQSKSIPLYFLTDLDKEISSLLRSHSFCLVQCDKVNEFECDFILTGETGIFLLTKEDPNLLKRLCSQRQRFSDIWIISLDEIRTHHLAAAAVLQLNRIKNEQSTGTFHYVSVTDKSNLLEVLRDIAEKAIHATMQPFDEELLQHHQCVWLSTLPGCNLLAAASLLTRFGSLRALIEAWSVKDADMPSLQLTRKVLFQSVD